MKRKYIRKKLYSRKNNVLCVEYWIAKGYNKENAIIEISNIQSKRTKKGIKNSKVNGMTGKNHYEIWLKEYNEKHGRPKKHRDRVIGDSLRWATANWVEPLLEMVQSREIDSESVKLFLTFINPHDKLKKGNKWQRGARALWQLYGYENFESLPEQVQQNLLKNNINSLEMPQKKADNIDSMILFAFDKAIDRTIKLSKFKNIGTKVAFNVDKEIKKTTGRRI